MKFIVESMMLDFFYVFLVGDDVVVNWVFESKDIFFVLSFVFYIIIFLIYINYYILKRIELKFC